MNRDESTTAFTADQAANYDEQFAKLSALSDALGSASSTPAKLRPRTPSDFRLAAAGSSAARVALSR